MFTAPQAGVFFGSLIVGHRKASVASESKNIGRIHYDLGKEGPSTNYVIKMEF